MAQKKDPVTRKWYFYGTRLDDFGNPKQYKKRGFETKSEAKEAERLFRLEVEGKKLNKGRLTFEQLAEIYTNQNTQNKASSKQSDKDTIKKINLELGNIIASKITSIKLQKYVNELDDQYSMEYVKKIYYVINKIFEYGILHDYLNVNPLKKVKRSLRKDVIREEMKFWEPEHFKQFIKGVDKEKDFKHYVLINFLYFMGCRRGEALALQWKDIDFKKGTAHIYKTVNYKMKGVAWLLTPPKNENAFRTISVPSNLLAILKEWKCNQSEMYEFTGDRFLFGYDRPEAPENIRRFLKNTIANANKKAEQSIPEIRIHDLRHSHASYLINNKSDRFTDYDIAQRLGDTVQTLLDTYTHWFKSADKGIIDFMDEDFK